MQVEVLSRKLCPFYNALKQAYPDIKAISNCDASSKPLDHPADSYDFHIYTSSDSMFEADLEGF